MIEVLLVSLYVYTAYLLFQKEKGVVKVCFLCLGYFFIFTALVGVIFNPDFRSIEKLFPIFSLGIFITISAKFWNKIKSLVK